jgi:hypothetical protein
LSIRKYISKDILERIAIEKYKNNGLGITFEDIEREFSLNKVEARRRLKYFHERQVLFTANNLKSEGITVLKHSNTPTCIMAGIVEGLSKENVLVNPTGVDLLAPPSSFKSPTSNDFNIVQTLEGYVLPLLPKAPIFLHNFHFKIRIDPECFADLELPCYDKNNGKRHSESIGTSRVMCYMLYPKTFELT